MSSTDPQALRPRSHRRRSRWLPAWVIVVLLVIVAAIGVFAAIALQTRWFGAYDSSGTVTVGAPRLTAPERAELLTVPGMQAELRAQLEKTWTVGALDCDPFPSDDAHATTTCAVELDGQAYTAGLEVTPEEPDNAFVLTGVELTAG